MPDWIFQTRNSLRPGVRLGAYPQREDIDAGFADRITDSVSVKWQQLKGKRNSSLNYIREQVEKAAQSLPKTGSREFEEHIEELKFDLARDGLQTALVAKAFATVRACAEQTLGKRHYDVQLMAAWAMMQGYMVEMGTGEGKSLTATLAAACAGMAKIPTHVITTNEYLACRDAADMSPLYRALGLHCTAVTEDMNAPQRRSGYAADVTYCTNKQVAFDYLRDRLVTQNESSQLALRLRQFDPETGPVLRGLCFAIVDEADSVLIDEACTPLLLSREVKDPGREQMYTDALALAEKLQLDKDFTLKQAELKATLTNNGKSRLEELCSADSEAGIGLQGIWRGKQRREWLLQQALAALYIFRADEHYLIRDDQIEIIDPNTGRTMPDRSWQQGLHQMVETKEGCTVTGQRETLARISYQRFFLRYLHLTGMSGTLSEVAGELQSVYNKPLLVVPPNKPRQVRGLACHVSSNSDAKWQAIAERVADLHKSGQPILLGTASVANSERLSELLNTYRIPHLVLSARQDAQEAQVVAGAGLRNAVTVATNMAGRGTDIKLGRGVERLGGLHVIACEPNQSGRVDRQLFGRCGRQGEHGSFEMYVSLDDALVSDHLPNSIHTLGLKIRSTVPSLAASLLTRLPQRTLQQKLRAQRRQVLFQDKQMEDLLAFSGRSE
ncbi:MAG: prepilin peptidase [Pseudomonadota bacterium]